MFFVGSRSVKLMDRANEAKRDFEKYRDSTMKMKNIAEERLKYMRTEKCSKIKKYQTILYAEYVNFRIRKLNKKKDDVNDMFARARWAAYIDNLMSSVLTY